MPTVVITVGSAGIGAAVAREIGGHRPSGKAAAVRSAAEFRAAVAAHDPQTVKRLWHCVARFGA